MSAVVKVCGCGRIYTAAAWAALDVVGTMPSEEPTFDLDMRNCPCGSTIAIQVPASKDKCERHIGDVGDFERYRPCGAPAPYAVKRGGDGTSPDFWMACRKHAIEVSTALGVDIDGMTRCEACLSMILPDDVCACGAVARGAA